MTGRTAVDVKLDLYELEALIGWHTDQKWRHADREEYREAEDCKRRIDELYEILNKRRKELEVEAAVLRLSSADQ